MSRTELFLSCVSASPIAGLVDLVVNGSAALQVDIRLASERSLVLSWYDTAPKTALRVELEKPSMSYEGEESAFAAYPDAERTDMDGLIDRLLSIVWDDAPPLTSVLGATVREWREDRGLTRRDLAPQLGVSVGWLAAFENGCVAADELDAALIEDMAQALKIEPLALKLLAELDEDALWKEVDQLREQECQKQERKCSYHP